MKCQQTRYVPTYAGVGYVPVVCGREAVTTVRRVPMCGACAAWARRLKHAA